ncbi:MAG: alpha-L-rhamnosidase C-terminal domain-containing protein [Flectobacillus sp.]|uniref:alpha-L-rhamnosidase-related protein n=1 Tax=Flectobacillus sp. TaxID=50419 RepID=UPI003B9C9805
MKRLFFLLILFALGLCSRAQSIHQDILHKVWTAYWIAAPHSNPQDYGVYHFRKNFVLNEVPSDFIVHVSADNRYKLFVNGQMASQGPARGDLSYWNFETIDIAPYLKKGKNVIASIVWNEGNYRAEGQISNRTAFVLTGNTTQEKILDTNPTWKSFTNAAYQPLSKGVGYPTYYVAGSGELLDYNKALSADWASENFDDDSWVAAQQVGWRGACPKGISDINNWMLVPSSLPQMELRKQYFSSLRKVEGIVLEFASLEKLDFVIPPNTHAKILLDQGFLTNAFPKLVMKNGKNTQIGLTYAEALMDKEALKKRFILKNNRNEIEGKVIVGRKDSLLLSGKSTQIFESLSYRTFRYLQLDIQTSSEPLQILEISSTFVGFPFTQKSQILSTNFDFQTYLNVGWRTARLCAVDTYMDCPYYEQLQYIGDARIQALVSYFNAGDDRLARNALNQMDHSRMAEGITLSRHPSYSPQQIPTFSLWYIGMLHDYLRYRNDAGFVKEKLQGVRNVLWFFEKHQNSEGSLRKVPYWIFTDWVENRKGWSNGEAPLGNHGESAVLDLQLLWAYQLAAELEAQLGMKTYAEMYNQKVVQLKNMIRRKYWDASKGLLADTEQKDFFSQHANSLGILTGVLSPNNYAKVTEKLLQDKSLASASIYFKYYLHQALVKAGRGDEYLRWLGDWKRNIDLGLTTWAEISEIEHARSDCHAWGASPNIEFYRVVLGIDSDAQGFSKIKIEPHLGSLKAIQGQMPHPLGKIVCDYVMKNNHWEIHIECPVEGKLVWKGNELKLKKGLNQFRF